MASKLTSRNKPSRADKLVTLPQVEDEKPSISITYLDNHHDFKHFFSIAKGNAEYIRVLQDFLKKARCYSNIDELISNHKPHHRIKNSDDKSVEKMKQIQSDFNIETRDMIHLHCCRGGSGSFVLHGFRIKNRFEIVWLDPTHDIHS